MNLTKYKPNYGKCSLFGINFEEYFYDCPPDPDLEVEFSDLLGKTIVAIYANVGNDIVYFVTETMVSYCMYHRQSCCERVSLEDIIGDFEDILDQPILLAECVSSNDYKELPDMAESKRDSDAMISKTKKVINEDCIPCYQWTFYKLATNKGFVTMRWFGGSNGCYAMDASLYRMDV